MPKEAIPGGDYVYQPSHGDGLGEAARGEDLNAEMAELDLKPGTPVTVLELDADTDWPIIRWQDDAGIERNTTIAPDVFDADFTPT